MAPESLSKDYNIDFLKNQKISFVAVDEAHCISEWGHDFRPDYRNIFNVVKKIDPRIKITALTATATPKVQDDIIKNLDLNEPKYLNHLLIDPICFMRLEKKTIQLINKSYHL